MRHPLVFLAIVSAGLLGCAATPRVTQTPTSTLIPAPSSTAASLPPSASLQPSASAPATPEPSESSGTTTGGDIPDNAIFLTYADAAHLFGIQYVEGWQVTPSADGVVIRDKDSSETVQVVGSVVDIPSYISATDLPQLQSLAGFSLQTQDTVKVNGQQLNHLVYHAPSPPDPVTGKEVPSTIDRYYVPGANGQLAIVTLSTPDGVDNVDAFRQMIQSFTWS